MANRLCDNSVGKAANKLSGLGTDFAVASLVCGLAGTAELLVAGRFVQGGGGALGPGLGRVLEGFPGLVAAGNR